MATPKKPGQRVMLTEGYGEVKFGQTGRVTRRRTEQVTRHIWSVRLDNGRSVEVQEDHLHLFND